MSSPVLVDTRFQEHKTFEFPKRRYVIQKVKDDEVYRLTVYKTLGPAGYGILQRVCEMYLSDKKLQEVLKQENLA
jgi:hypothetical protein